MPDGLTEGQQVQTTHTQTLETQPKSTCLCRGGNLT